MCAYDPDIVLTSWGAYMQGNRINFRFETSLGILAAKSKKGIVRVKRESGEDFLREYHHHFSCI